MTLQLEPTPDEREAMAILKRSDVINTLRFAGFMVFVFCAAFGIGWLAFNVPSLALDAMGF